MKIRAPFLIETRKWPLAKLCRAWDAGYRVCYVFVIRIDGKLKICWTWIPANREEKWQHGLKTKTATNAL
jgi:hypothetical protein